MNSDIALQHGHYIVYPVILSLLTVLSKQPVHVSDVNEWHYPITQMTFLCIQKQPLVTVLSKQPVHLSDVNNMINQ